MWERMVCSVRRVVNCDLTARCWLDTIIEAEPPQHLSDGLSDLYWVHRLVPGETDRGACEKARSEFDEVSKPLMTCGWGMDEQLGVEWEIVDGTVTM